MRSNKRTTFVAIKSHLVIMAILLVLTLSACSQQSSQDEASNDTFSAHLPKALKVLDLDETNLVVEVVVDGGARQACTDLVVDTMAGTYSCRIQLSAGSHTFTLVYSVIDVAYGTVQVATSSGINVNVVAGEETPADFSVATLTYDDGDGDGISNLDELDAGSNPENQSPLANAGTPRQDVSRGVNVYLDGSASSDADGDTLTFTWNQTDGPDVTGDTGSLTGEAPSFQAPAEVDTLIFELVVNDGKEDSVADTVIVNVFEDADVAYFVDGDNGSDDTGNGGQGNPFASIAKALCEVTPDAQDIYVMTRASSAVYDETVDPCPGDPARNTDQILNIPTGTSLYGGYDANWMRDVTNNQSPVSTLHHGFLFTSVDLNAWFSGFNVVADNSPDPASSAYVLSALGGDAGIFIHDNQLTAGDVAIGNEHSPGSSYGLRVALMETATIERNIISAGFAGDGLDLNIVFQDSALQGATGVDGVGRTAGGGGDGRGPEDYDGGAGGGGGSWSVFCAIPAGASGSTGQGPNAGGGGALGAGCGGTGSPGGVGGTGSPGGRGTGGNSSGGMDVYENSGFFASFVIGSGIIGNTAQSGSGGGGGGGGAGDLLYNGGGGGGGGGGGAGGAGGTGGDGGGASIGLFIASVNTVVIDNNEITSGVGGNGATGGLGQLGGLGGLSGNGSPATAGAGGDGGAGGIGGTGGRGGAGGGGPSYGILFDGLIEPVISNNIITSHDGGTGGDGSTGGDGGNGGHSYAIYIFTGSAEPLLTANERFFGTPGDGGTSVGGTAGVPGESGENN